MKRRIAYLLLLSGCWTSHDLELGDASRPTSAHPACVEGATGASVRLIEVIEEPTRRRDWAFASSVAIGDRDHIAVGGAFGRRSGGSWMWSEPLHVTRLEGDVALSVHGVATLYRRNGEGFEVARRHERAVRTAAWDGEQLVLAAHDRPELFFFDHWDTPTAEGIAVDMSPGPVFGGHSALSGDWLVVTSHPEVRLIHRGADGTWRLEQTLPIFGDRVALAHDVLAVRTGTSGPLVHYTVKIYHRVGEHWEFMQELSPTEVPRDHVVEAGGTRRDWFGDDIRISGDWMAVGSRAASYCGAPTDRRGGVFLYHRVADVWTLERVVLPPVGVARPNSLFGFAVDFDRTFLLVTEDGERDRVFWFEFVE